MENIGEVPRWVTWDGSSLDPLGSSVYLGEVSLKIYPVALLFHQNLPSAKAGDRHRAGWTLLTPLILQASCEVAQVLPTVTSQLLISS